MADLPIVCPAATAIYPAGDEPSVVCGVLELSNEGADAHGFQSRGQVSPVFSGSRDSGTVHWFCAGPGIAGSKCSYTACAIWQAEKAAIWAARRGPGSLRDPLAHRAPEIDPELAEYVSLTSGLGATI